MRFSFFPSLNAFQSTPSVWRETIPSESNWVKSVISIHSLRVEGDCFGLRDQFSFPISIHSLRVEGDAFPAWEVRPSEYFNPLPPCGGRPKRGEIPVRHIAISIHSLRVEGDDIVPPDKGRDSDFNPLPPCGGRPLAPMCQMESMEFQSTPSVWRETYQIGAFFATPVFQSTPSVWRETRTPEQLLKSLNISIHSLRVEGDEMYRQSAAQQTLFQSTPSVWRETQTLWAALSTSSISIHSLRVEGDPRGRRRTSQRQKFQSTPSVWRETLLGVPLPDILKISIHSLRVEGDDVSRMLLFAYQISIHSLRVEGDSKIAQLSA